MESGGLADDQMYAVVARAGAQYVRILPLGAPRARAALHRAVQGHHVRVNQLRFPNPNRPTSASSSATRRPRRRTPVGLPAAYRPPWISGT